MNVYITIERRDNLLQLDDPKGDFGQSSLRLKGDYLEVVGVLPHGHLIRPKTEADRMAMIRWLAALNYSSTDDDHWNNNAIQFPRLLAEINATQEHFDESALADAMDISIPELDELFDRAGVAWERIKAEIVPVENHSNTDEA